eukprot:CAMPEP_0176106840 /NCGR_PEP_ID=MMETSP0120_2-20121206/53615_1 /TAXON_ID=160619 /ORGANISM="Kryptoperidinium foliaceum, Strain CCMP 1326" /LENGTH=266 /DNA_ID=CAMNT_0017440963 /DNA_START=53 /DNA_END=853 /DNA_ORIENTATION=-
MAGLLRKMAVALLLTPGAAVKPALRSSVAANASASTVALAAAGKQQGAPCQCEASNPAWKACQRTTPKCVFIDLGAADGNSFGTFINNGYGPVANCPSGQWEAYLVEANPRFDAPLQKLVGQYPAQVHADKSTAAFFCEGTTTFYLDTQNHAQNYWGSSLSSNHPDAQKSGLQGVSVHLMNLNRLLAEKTIPGDWVMVKMDIEGAEYDVLPCLAQAPAASLIDRLYMEEHAPSWSMTGGTAESLKAAKETLKSRGVDIPPYFSQTL